ncbi:MAG TPA: winged helix DNA-binding domain-containing protein [Actinomycetota bacterium]|nr:winged helix DNA-binding domain-containing protein [Actinomycetota bacterium]
MRIDDAQRRARLVDRHHLNRQGKDPVSVARDLIGFHSSDPASVYLSARARVAALEPGTLEEALYEKRSLVRILGMRRTMFVVPSELVPIVHAACTRAIAVRERKRTLQLLEGAGMTGVDRTLADAEALVLGLLRQVGEATTTEVTAQLPELSRRIPVGVGTKGEGTIGFVPRVLFMLATDGRIVRGRPRGSWLSSQYRWGPMPARLLEEMESLDARTARAGLARLWLRSFGPATAEDLKWWTGWGVRETRTALQDVGAVEVELDGSAGWVLPDDNALVRHGDPACALLPSLDPTTMGWRGRQWYLGDHRQALFDLNGNAGSTVWWDGRVIGGWGQRRSGEVVVRLLEDAGSEARAAVDEEADALRAWLGAVRVIPRFRTPLEKELSES